MTLASTLITRELFSTYMESMYHIYKEEGKEDKTVIDKIRVYADEFVGCLDLRSKPFQKDLEGFICVDAEWIAECVAEYVAEFLALAAYGIVVDVHFSTAKSGDGTKGFACGNSLIDNIDAMLNNHHPMGFPSLSP